MPAEKQVKCKLCKHPIDPVMTISQYLRKPAAYFNDHDGDRPHAKPSGNVPGYCCDCYIYAPQQEEK